MRPWAGRLFKVLFILILAWAVFVRCWAVVDRPFWNDEAWVANAVTEMSTSQLFRQKEMPMPPLFAVSVKLIGSIISPPELGLRMLSIICGIALLPLCYLTGRSLYLPRFTALAGMALCASSPVLVTWSRELKQYETEAFFCILLAFLVFRLRRKTPGQKCGPTIAGIIAICLLGPWFGFASVFGIAALLVILLLLKPVSASRRRVAITASVGFIVLAVSVLSLWLFSAADQADNEALQSYTKNWYINVTSLKSWARAGAYAAITSIRLILPFSAYLARYVWIGILAVIVWIVILIGLYSWPRKGRLAIACWVLGPWLLMMIAAMAQLYPFGVMRMMAFWAGPPVLAFTLGMISIFRFFCRALGTPSGYGIGAGLILSLVPIVYMVNIPLAQRYWVCHDFPAVLRVLEERRQGGEMVLVAFGAVPSVRFYAGKAGESFRYVPTVAGAIIPLDFKPDQFVDQALQRPSKRWWVITTSDDPGRLPYLIRKLGYDVRLIIEAGGDREYALAQLFAVTKPNVQP